MQAEYELLAGILLGATLGVLAQRSRLCMGTALWDALNRKTSSGLLPFILSLLLLALLLPPLAYFGLLEPPQIESAWLRAFAGGLVFGLGMACAGGCVLGTWFRAGEGSGVALCACVGFLLGLSRWPEPDETALAPSLTAPWAALLLPVLSLVLVFTLFWLLLRRWRTAWRSLKPGIALAAVSFVAVIAAQALSHPLGLNLAAGGKSAASLFRAGRAHDFWSLGLLAGVPLGSLLSAFRANELKWRPPDVQPAFLSLAGGMLMGVGASLAGGCNLALVLMGLPMLSVWSIVAVGAMVLGYLGGVALLRRSVR